MSDQKDPMFLDLDALTPEVEVSIKLGGEKHIMAEMTVADFVWAQRLAGEQKNLTEDSSDEDLESVMGSMSELLCRQFPTCDPKMIKGLSISKLTALIKFTGQLGAEGAPAAVAEVGASEEGEVELVETDMPNDQ